jgi:anaerobic selenocysteine-containing dehydrogenase
MHTSDASRLGIGTGDTVKVTTEIGHFIARVWVTEGIRPGVVGCSHHMGRWRPEGAPADAPGCDRWMSSVVRIEERPDGTWRLSKVDGAAPFESHDPDSQRIWWADVGVHQNLTFPVHPDPVSGQHCWHQRVRVEPAGDCDEGEVVVDPKKADAVYREWLARARPATGELRRPLWLQRPNRPSTSAFRR